MTKNTEKKDMKRGSAVTDALPWLLLSLLVLAFLIYIAYKLKIGGISIIDRIRGLSGG